MIICQGRTRARKTCEELGEDLWANARVLAGGINGWEAAGFPTVTGKGAIAMERQVRITAGPLVLIGAILGYTTSINWVALSAFVGAGLVFAGITDSCGMSQVLALLPWNKRQINNRSCDTKLE